MGKIEAWIKRDMERREFLESLMREVESFIDKADEELGRDDGNIATFCDLSVALILGLKRRGENIPEAVENSSDVLDSFLRIVVLPAVENFARSPAEETFLRGQLLDKMLGPVKSFADMNLRREETIEPEKIFRAPSAMTEVDWGG